MQAYIGSRYDQHRTPVSAVSIRESLSASSRRMPSPYAADWQSTTAIRGDRRECRYQTGRSPENGSNPDRVRGASCRRLSPTREPSAKTVSHIPPMDDGLERVAAVRKCTRAFQKTHVRDRATVRLEQSGPAIHDGQTNGRSARPPSMVRRRDCHSFVILARSSIASQ